jgi:hypothetical protein
VPASRTRPDLAPVVKLTVGDGEPSVDRDALAARRRSSPTLPAPPLVAHERAPFAWLLAGDDAHADDWYGPDWAW